jgi:hypothetical protein
MKLASTGSPLVVPSQDAVTTSPMPLCLKRFAAVSAPTPPRPVDTGITIFAAWPLLRALPPSRFS